jgi:hypothetical protein
MNQTKLANWIEQAEARRVCDLAKADPNMFKVSAGVWVHRASTEMEKTGFLHWLRHCRPVERIRAAA